jgi:hypothetical protein
MLQLIYFNKNRDVLTHSVELPNIKKVVGSIPNEVIGIFNWHTPSSRTVALGSTQPLTEMSKWSLLGLKGSWWIRLSSLPPSESCLEKCGSLDGSQPYGPPRHVTGIALPLGSSQVVMHRQKIGQSW